VLQGKVSNVVSSTPSHENHLTNGRTDHQLNGALSYNSKPLFSLNFALIFLELNLPI